ncbi:MAG TPA: copper amine oxidase N-terminal domain-containing protein, partial [Clostridia bacterium]
SNQSYYDKAAELFTKSSDKSIKVFADGSLIDFSKYDNVLPVIKENRTLIPVRALVESLGGNVDWDSSRSLITITLGDKVVKLTLNSDTAYVNDKTTKLDIPAQTINGRTMVPLRFVSENFGKKVDWHPYTGGTSIVSVIDN